MRYAVWAVALAIDLATPLARWRDVRLVPVHASHLPERFGLFTLIVLGETVLAVVLGTESVRWTLDSGLVSALGFTIGASFWWLYFDFVDSARLRPALLYVYAHMPLVAGLTAVGVGVKLAITEAGGPDLSGRRPLDPVRGHRARVRRGRAAASCDHPLWPRPGRLASASLSCRRGSSLS